jgi:hypothetical protein
MSHRAKMQVRNVPHVHNAEIDARSARHAVHQSLTVMLRPRSSLAKMFVIVSTVATDAFGVPPA